MAGGETESASGGKNSGDPTDDGQRSRRGGGAGGGACDCRSANLLVGEHAAALQGRQVAAVTVAVEQSGAGSVVFAEDGAVDVVESVSGHQSVSTGGTAETLEVVNISLRPHHHLVGGDRLAAGDAHPAVAEESDVVAATQDHASFAVAGGADVAELSLAAGALEAASVPVALHGEEQEAVGDLPSAAGARPGGRGHRGGLAVHHPFPKPNVLLPR